MKVVVVTGGTQVDWDDMRTLTNKSTGKFGCRIADAYHYVGCKVTLVHAESVSPDWVSPGVTDRRSFRTYDELYDILEDLSDEPFDIIVMAAAISDYAFDTVQGKVRSDQDTMTVTLRRTKKILGEMREWYRGFRPFIVGFKLLSDVEPSELRSAAYSQIKKCKLDLTLVNDWAELRANPGQHPCYFVTPEGGFIRQEGSKQEIAKRLVDFTLKRRNVTWSRSQQSEHAPSESELSSRDSAVDLLKFGQSFGLFDETINGSVTYRIPKAEASMWATPRSISKNLVEPTDMVYTQFHVCGGTNYYSGDVKPEIDSVIHARLYDMYPSLSAILHFHGGYVIPDVTTSFPYPCGVRETAFEILDTMDWKFEGSTLVELVDHGYLILLEKGAEELWNSAASILDAVGRITNLQNTELSPVFIGAEVVGMVIKRGEQHQLFVSVQHQDTCNEDKILDLLPEGTTRLRMTCEGEVTIA